MARTYREAGVDREEAERAVERIAAAAAQTSTDAVLGGVGGFGALYRFDPSTYPDPIIVSSTDGVGTKLKVALALGRHDTIGIDLVNACVNDIIVTVPTRSSSSLPCPRRPAVRDRGGDRRRRGGRCVAAGIRAGRGETAQMPTSTAATT